MSDAAIASSDLVREKLAQAVAILDEQDTDLWLTFVRETMLTRDPALDLLGGVYCAWHGAFLVSRGGERVAIVGRFDAPSVEALDSYDRVVGYDESYRPALEEELGRIDPSSIALNYSENDPAADGLTHGLWLTLQDVLRDHTVLSSEPIVATLRGRKSAGEIELVRAAVTETEDIFDVVTRSLTPGMSELEIADVMHAEVERRGLGYAWGRDHCPAVNAGPDKEVGHAGPTELEARRGELVHVDFGVSRDGYCSDLQRVWYLLDEGGTEAPEDVTRAWDALWGAVDAGAEALRPGVAGWEVDAAARESLVAAGFPEPKYALGHGLGRSAHDGGTLLGPRWEQPRSCPRRTARSRSGRPPGRM